MMTLKQIRKKEYNSTQYQTNRKIILNSNPLCAMCIKEGRIKAATQIDHIINIGKWIRDKRAPRGLSSLQNLQGLCLECHIIKSAKEEEEHYLYKPRKKKFIPPKFNIDGRRIDKPAKVCNNGQCK